MAMMGGNEATNIANANKIIEEFRIIGAAMNMYYADNRSEVGTTEESALPGKIKTGIAVYMKNTDAIAATATAGKYNISVQNGEWWLTYTLPIADSKVAKILANKASEEGLKASITTAAVPASGEGESAVAAQDAKLASDYVSTSTSVCWQVR